MAEEEKQAKPRNMAKILSFAFLALNLAVMGACGFMVYSSTLGYKTPEVSEGDLNRELASFRESLQGTPVMYNLGSFTTNLDGLPRRIVRVEVNLEMLDAEGFEEAMGKASESQDSVVRILNGKKLTDLESVQGKLRLKNQIITQVNSMLDRGVVKNVYFSDFVIQ